MEVLLDFMRACAQFRSENDRYLVGPEIEDLFGIVHHHSVLDRLVQELMFNQEDSDATRQAKAVVFEVLARYCKGPRIPHCSEQVPNSPHLISSHLI
jgi:hypothetical protein